MPCPAKTQRGCASLRNNNEVSGSCRPSPGCLVPSCLLFILSPQALCPLLSRCPETATSAFKQNCSPRDLSLWQSDSPKEHAGVAKPGRGWLSCVGSVFISKFCEDELRMMTHPSLDKYQSPRNSSCLRSSCAFWLPRQQSCPRAS